MKTFSLAFLLLFGIVHAQNIETNLFADSCLFENTLRNKYPLALYDNYYSFINYGNNVIVGKPSNYQIFNELVAKKRKNINILHIGDSHIYADYFTGNMRQELQMIFGDAGRGIVFPSCVAGLHAVRDYKTTCTGKWLSSKTTELNPVLDIGLLGVTAKTNDTQATATFIFKHDIYSICDDTLLLTVLCKNSPESFKIKIQSGNNVWEETPQNSTEGTITGQLVTLSDTLNISFYTTDSLQNFFELYGIILKSKNSSGVLYHAAGINGASLRGLRNQNLLASQVSCLVPDIIIIDLGTNDICRGYFDDAFLKETLQSVIQKIRGYLPETQIILIPPQDMYFKRKHITSPERYSGFLSSIASAQHCLFYNYFEVSGGNLSMLKWQKNLLARPDKIHLTNEGYELKAKLFTQAFLRLYLNLGDENIQISGNCIHKLFKDSTLVFSQMNNTVEINNSAQEIQMSFTTHTVRKGESLSLIATKYKVSIEQLKEWNNLSSATIYPGQKLTIRQNESEKKEYAQRVQNKTYIVQKGDSLYSIAQKHNVTVENIKQWNKLDSQLIKPGQKLIVQQ